MEYLPNEGEKTTKGTRIDDLVSANSSLFILLNPVAGSCKAELVKKILKQQCALFNTDYKIYETTGREHIPTIVRQAITQGYRRIVVAGGDGTISAVASELIQSEIILGIIPVGTANLLARELKIPLELEAACQLVVKGGRIKKIDAMKVGDRSFLSNISVGSYARIGERTSIHAKRYFRQLAYAWSALAELIGTHAWRFKLSIDNREQRMRAAFIMIANVGEMGAASLRWGTDVKPDDGQVDICIVRARTLPHYLSFIWHILRGQHKQSPHILYLRAQKNIKASTRWGLPVRGDGEIIGRSSIEIQIIPKAISIMVPILYLEKQTSGTKY
ncbi:diacylglycerol kinase catalytic region [Nitrosococcus halophilus Nc 4]|uniref:Diacylglycerol kinase catalytic region n=1 Tax=Nitrosococcus halophilus (strain Nc4) TaxID=472759 RepID=D5C1S5_NITHN|nr:diacylglycerol kinase family protein [Nitrosococcus halophilus]ADE14708.1 diacylglycerol kinase catalytic region [Nitrosococcus halophilus Nc 4]